MKRFSLLVLAITVCLGLMAGEAFAKKNQKSNSGSSASGEYSENRQGLGYEKWQEMHPAQQRELQERYRKFQELSPQEQQKLRRRYEQFKDLPVERQQQMMERHQRLQQLSPDERRQLRREWQQIKELPPEQRGQRQKELQREIFNDINGSAAGQGEKMGNQGRNR